MNEMTITLPRATVEQALEALDHEIDTRRCKSSTLRAMISLRAALAQQAETEEPVAWRVQRSDGQYELYFVKASAERAAECYIKRPQIEPLYAAPPQRKPLTEEEIDALPWNGSPRQFARAVEKASWEKNHGQT